MVKNISLNIPKGWGYVGAGLFIIGVGVGSFIQPYLTPIEDACTPHIKSATKKLRSAFRIKREEKTN